MHRVCAKMDNDRANRPRQRPRPAQSPRQGTRRIRRPAKGTHNDATIFKSNRQINLIQRSFMKLPQTTLNLKDVVVELPTPASILKPKKQLFFLSYTVSAGAIHDLNALVKKGITVAGVAAKVEGMLSMCKFPMLINRKLHAKVWICDEKVYVGSANMTGDTLLNLTVQVKGKQAKEVIAFVQSLLSFDCMPLQNLIL